jgi:hypothetical protein
VFGAFVLGAALAYGVARAGWLKPRERAQLDQKTRAQQRGEDPQKRPMTKNEAHGADLPGKGIGRPWERPGQLGQNPDWKEPRKPDLEKWKQSETH